MTISSPKHLNRNIYAAVAVETTGPLVGFHDVHKICIIPLDSFYAPAKVIPFLVEFKPIREETPWLSYEKLVKAKAGGVPPSMAPDILELWFKKLQLPNGKKLCPISQDWGFTIPFFRELFGPTLCDEVFFEVPRDLKSVAAYLNDCADLNSESIPFARYGIQSICGKLNVIIDEPIDVLNACKATAAAYKAILKRMF